MTVPERALFLSLRPLYAEMILSGSKTVELRRIRPKAEPGSLVIVYASSPVRHILGTCIVEDIGSGTPDEIWRLHGPQTGIAWGVFSNYFIGIDQGVAITVRNARRLDEPIPLDVVRHHLKGFMPPQSFRYIGRDHAYAVLGHEFMSCLLRSAHN
jgi:predicted transcriptional regulator